MSTLTKILIVLVTISSIFLCGIVVAYVAKANNYRELYNTQQSAKDSLEQNVKDLKEQLKTKTTEKDDLEDKLSKQINALKIEVDELKTQLKNASRENANLLNEVETFASEVKTFTKTNAELTSLLDDTTKTWKTVEANLIKEQSQHKDTSKLLLEKMAIIQTLETEKKQLIEQKVALQGRLDKLLQPTGKMPTVPVTVTSEKDVARPAPVTTRDISLKGMVKAVNLKNKLVSISIGTADGVSEGMRFHITRGDTFICDILIIDTDAEEAVGAIELTGEGQQPKAGDIISTNL